MHSIITPSVLLIVNVHPTCPARSQTINSVPNLEQTLLRGLFSSNLGVIAACTARPVLWPAALPASRGDRVYGAAEGRHTGEEVDITAGVHSTHQIHERISPRGKFSADVRFANPFECDPILTRDDLGVWNSLSTIHAGRSILDPVGNVSHQNHSGS